jgi:peptide deformylase
VTNDDEGARLVRLMRELAIVQAGDPILTRRDLPRFRLPEQAAEARSLVERLSRKADEIQRHYPFDDGMGLAAPQLGVARRAAVGRPAGSDQIVLLNPVVVAAGAPGPAPVFEGCLSFFEVRGRVARPKWILVEHTTLDGAVVRTRFEDDAARLLTHEIDHLDGVLYPERMADGEKPIPVYEYRKLS